MRGGWLAGFRGRFAVAALAGAVVAIVILAVGVLLVAADTFTQLMREHGASTAASEEMFGSSVARVFALAVVVAMVASGVLAFALARRLAAPLQAIRDAARRIARGDYAARIPLRGPEEIASLADSFNRMAASLEEQERLRRDFIANASHELRTPLTNLRGYLEALRDGVIAPSPGVFDSLSDEVDRLSRLADSLNALAEGDAPTITAAAVEFDLSAAVRTAAELAQPAFERAGLSVSISVPDGLRARAVPDHLPRVLGNLLQNAARYTPRGGHVTVSAAPGAPTTAGGVGATAAEDASAVLVAVGTTAASATGAGPSGTAAGPSGALVSVTNTGSAIPAEDLPHLFERFYRVEKSRDAARGGAGIGLAIVRQLVEADGGTVGVTSGEGETRFWFTLPR